MDITITLKYDEGHGWKGGFTGIRYGKTFSYAGEYKPTIDEAYAATRKALSVYNLLDLAS